MWLAHAALNHFKLIASAVLVADLQRSGAAAATSPAAQDQTVRQHHSTHTDWFTYKPTTTIRASSIARRNQGCILEVRSNEQMGSVTDQACGGSISLVTV